MGPDDAKAIGLDDRRGVVLGQKSDGELLYFNGDGHLMIFAPTGAGKGIGFVQPNLVEYQGSMVVLDPKGENAIVSAAHRAAMGQQVIILDPFGVTGRPSATFNPLGALTYADSHTVGPWVECLAEAMIRSTNEKDEQWTLGARKFASFVMWWLIAHEPPEKRNLIRVFEIAHSGYDKLSRMAAVMSEGRSPDPEVARICKALGHWFLGRQPKEFSYFESIVSNQLGWIGDFVWSSVLAGPPSPPLPLKTQKGGITVYLVLPFHRIERYQNWLRLMVADLLSTLYETPGSPANPVLFLMDEAFAGLGRMDSLFTAAAAVRGAGARLAFVYQDVAQVNKLYGNAWHSLVANAGATLFWSVNDLEAAKFISERCGQRTAQVPGMPQGVAQPLIRVEEIIGLPADEIIGLFRNSPPARFGRLNVLTDRRFSSKLDKNRTYGTPQEKDFTARTDFVPVDLDDVKPKQQRPYDDDRREADETDDQEVRLLKTLSDQFGTTIIRRGNAYGYLNDRGFFVPVVQI